MSFAAITALLTMARSILSLAQEARTVARQNKQLTPQEESELDAQIARLKSDVDKPAHWRLPPSA